MQDSGPNNLSASHSGEISKSGTESRRQDRVLCHAHKTLQECALHSLKGILLGFFGFTLPVSLRYRQFSGQRKGAALAALLGSFRSLDCIIWRMRHFLEKSKQYPLLQTLLAKYSNGIAGGLSLIPPILIDKPSIVNSTMVLWLSVRGIRSMVPSVPYGAVIVMCLSAAQLLSTWAKAPSELSPSYRKFLDYHGGKSKEILKLIEGPPLQYSTCVSHEGVSCQKHFFVFFLQGLKRALPVYLPLHLVGFFLAKNKNLMHLVTNMARSCAFLALYCSLAWASGCVFFRMFAGGTTRLNMLCFLWVPGLASLLEREGRQKELAAYCLTHALDGLWGYLKEKYYVKPNDTLGSLLAVVAFGTIMHFHHHQPDFITRILFGMGMKERDLL